MNNVYSLMIHGGAGQFSDVKTDEDQRPYLQRIENILESGRTVLAKGGSAIDAVLACVSQLEDEPMFNAGKGSVLNAAGQVEMDAAIIDGRDLSAGAVGAVTQVKNPVLLANSIRQQGRHVMLVGKGALAFAKQQGLTLESNEYFIVEKRLRQFQKLQGTTRTEMDHDVEITPDPGHDTVGAVARDSYGNLAAATSTGGMTNKLLGRTGDSPIIGAGVYADNHTCAISATGHGEEIMRVVLAKRIADEIELCGVDLAQAIHNGLRYFVDRVHGRGGVIAVDSNGMCRSRYTTKHMVHGWIEQGGEVRCQF